MKQNLFGIVILFLSTCGWAQKHVSVNSNVVFFSKAFIEDITAKSQKSKSVIDLSTGNIAFSIPINSFEFRKSLMQEHFNEKYLESDIYPKSTFTATLLGFESGKDYDEIFAEGVLEIHGVKQNVKIPGSIIYNGSKLAIHSVFIIKIADYKIRIPRLMFQNIAEVIKVTIDFEYETNEK